MSLRQKFEGVGCPRFGNDKESAVAVDKTKRVVAAGTREIQAIHDEAVADLRKENKALRQQVAELTLKLAGTKNQPGDKKSSGPSTKNRATSGRGRPRLPDDERERRRKAQKAAARKPKP